MKKESIKYGFFTIIVLLIIMFIYPTIYRYDKFNQKVPVRINRITGSAEMLYQNGWEKAETASPSKTEMQIFQETMNQKFDGLKQDIEKDVTDKLTEEVATSIQDKITNVEKEISTYKAAQLDPNNSFTSGSTMDEVKKIMGVPTSKQTNEYLDQETWYYGFSYVTFKNKKVDSWNNSSRNLRLK